MVSWRLLISIAASLLAHTVQGKEPSANWSVELLVGDAYNATSRTRIRQGELGNISFSGDYQTHGLQSPLHYAWRIARWEQDKGWELQLLHHKIYLENRPAGVDALSVSHGFNILTVNRAIDYRGWRLRGGVGPVITHAEATVLGARYDGPYEIAGAAALIGVDRRLWLDTHWYLSGEVAGTYGYIRAQPDGNTSIEISIHNPAIHVQVGAGYRF